jgi:A/G-specific adenine glycosylase
LKREIREELAVEIEVGDQIGKYKHAYTHFKITLHAFSCMFLDGQKPQNLHHQKLAWVEPGQLEAYPMGKVDRKIANTLKDPDA